MDEVDSWRASVCGVPVEVLYSPMEEELERRAQVGAPAILDRQLISALCSLPPGLAIPLPFVSERFWPSLLTAHPAHVEMRDEGVVRIANPPAQICAVVVEGRSWASASRALSRVSRVAPTVVEQAGAHADLIAAAPFFGFGLASEGRLSSPPCNELAGMDPEASWHLCEALLSGGSPRPVFEGLRYG